MKKLISTMSMAVVAASTLGSVAFAQTMVGNQQVSAQDMARVTEHCATLSSTGGTMAKNGSGNDVGTQPADGTNSNTGTTTGTGGSASGTAMLNMNSITAADCKAAGLKTMN